MKVEISPQVADFIRKQPPEPRKKLKNALRSLAGEKGDIKPLEGSLENYHRLRVGGYRIIFAYHIRAGKRRIRCLFAERRNIVYEFFAEMLRLH